MRFGMRAAARLVSVGALAVAGAACGDDVDEPAVLRVPGGFSTIQAAVLAADPGDMVLVAEGTYTEAVRVVTPGVTIRGADRNEVVLDGEHEREDGIAVSADGVAIENMTVRNYRRHAVFFDGADGGRQPDDSGAYGTDGAALVGFRVSFVTTTNNGESGVAAFASTGGLIEHVVTSGNRVGGVAVSQCRPCNTVVNDVTAESNAVGFLGTNASTDLYVVAGTFRANRVGVATTSQETAQLAPQEGVVIAGNVVIDNDNAAAPATALGLFGGGVAVAGGTRNVVVRNRIGAHSLFGIGLLVLDGFDPIENRLESNVVRDNGVDLYYELSPGVVATFGNCFSANDFATSVPDAIQTVLPCGAPAGPVVPETVSAPDPPADVDHRAIPVPAAQPGMPGDIDDPPGTPATAPPFPDVDEIALPPEP